MCVWATKERVCVENDDVYSRRLSNADEGKKGLLLASMGRFPHLGKVISLRGRTGKTSIGGGTVSVLVCA